MQTESLKVITLAVGEAVKQLLPMSQGAQYAVVLMTPHPSGVGSFIALGTSLDRENLKKLFEEVIGAKPEDIVEQKTVPFSQERPPFGPTFNGQN